MSIPKFGLGTFRLTGQVVVDSVSNALALGYRAIDTAQIYGNEAEIGTAIQSSGVPRNELFLTTKIWVANLSKDKLIPSLHESLKKLQVENVDLTLIHWPAPENGVSVKEMMLALLEAKKKGLTQQIGVSNFNIVLTKQAIATVGAKEIATNQIELHPYLQNDKVVEFCQSEGIHITSYMTLAYGEILKDPVINDIAQKHQATPAQIALAWALKKNISVIPSSTRIEHLKSNLLAQELALTPDDIKRIKMLDCNKRLVSPENLAPQWD